MTTANQIDTAALTAPFQLNEVKFKPQSVKGNRALAMAYIDCRVIQDRLDGVLGVENWMDEYEIVPDGSVVCRLKLRINGEWVVKTDVGSPSEQPDSGDRLKAAFSDALKRAAVKYGIGRYLYRLPAVWCDYDPQKKQFSGTPQLPAWAIPKGQKQGQTKQSQQPEQTEQPAANGKPKDKPIASVGELWVRMGDKTPADGAKLIAGIAWADKVLVRLLGGEYTPGGLGDAVRQFARKGEVAGLADLTGDPLTGAWNNAKRYVKDLETPVKAAK